MFTVCSFLCGMANSLGEMVIFRLLQGFFGGGLQPNQQSIILDTFEPSQRGKAFSVVAVATIVAPVLGPTLGGWITDNYSWRWIFLINVPVGIAAFFAVAALVEDPPWVKREHEKGDWSIDYIGLGLIAIGLGCLEVMLDRGEDADWFGSPMIVTFAILAVVGIVGAVVWLLYAKKPVVNLRASQGSQFRGRLGHDLRRRRHPLFERGADPAARAAAPRLHGDLGRPGAVARRAVHHRADPVRQPSRDAERPDALHHRLRLLRARLRLALRHTLTPQLISPRSR